MSGNIVLLITELSRLKNEKDAMSEIETGINIRIEEITKKLLPEAMDEAGINNITVDNIGRVNLRGEVYASILVENRAAAYQWLRDTGRDSIITETVNSSTLKAAAKEWLKQGEEIPQELIKITPCTIAVLVRGK
jgi:hypothetical protein